MMKKVFLSLLFCLVAAGSAVTAGLLQDQHSLQEELIRLHVVAASDSEEDQAVKLRVRDEVLDTIQEAMASAGDPQAAEAYLKENLPRIEAAANSTLQALGAGDSASVTLCREAFQKRIYDTFSLPAGIYESLRVTIGEGQGHNWWCVAFPTLCMPAVSRDVETIAADAGLSPALAEAITGRREVRFYLLDLLGRLSAGRTPIDAQG